MYNPVMIVQSCHAGVPECPSVRQDGQLPRTDRAPTSPPKHQLTHGHPLKRCSAQFPRSPTSHTAELCGLLAEEPWAAGVRRGQVRLTDASPGGLVLVDVMAEEFGAPYTYAATHSEYTLPLTSRTVLEADLAALPFEIVFIERGVYDMVMRPIHTHFTTDDTRT